MDNAEQYITWWYTQNRRSKRNKKTIQKDTNPLKISPYLKWSCTKFQQILGVKLIRTDWSNRNKWKRERNSGEWYNYNNSCNNSNIQRGNEDPNVSYLENWKSPKLSSFNNQTNFLLIDFSIDDLVKIIREAILKMPKTINKKNCLMPHVRSDSGNTILWLNTSNNRWNRTKFQGTRSMLCSFHRYKSSI
jgi:hypothetical protein